MFQKTSGNKKVYGKEMGMGEYRKFPSKNFCLKWPKQFVGEPFTLSLVSGIEIVYASEGYVTVFRGIFLSHSTEPFRRGTLLCCVSKTSGREKVYGKEGGGGVSIFYVENFLSKIAERFRTGNL